MANLGMYFALTDAQRDKLLSMGSDDDRKYLISDEIEEEWDEENLCEVEKAWGQIHCVLNEYTPPADYFDFDAGKEPIKLAVLGGKRIMQEEDWYCIRMIEADKVPAVADAVATITQEEFAKRYWKHCESVWPLGGTEEGLEYSYGYFTGVQEFFARVRDSGRCVIFTADL